MYDKSIKAEGVIYDEYILFYLIFRVFDLFCYTVAEKEIGKD